MTQSCQKKVEKLHENKSQVSVGNGALFKGEILKSRFIKVPSENSEQMVSV